MVASVGNCSETSTPIAPDTAAWARLRPSWTAGPSPAAGAAVLAGTLCEPICPAASRRETDILPVIESRVLPQLGRVEDDRRLAPRGQTNGPVDGGRAGTADAGQDDPEKGQNVVFGEHAGKRAEGARTTAPRLWDGQTGERASGREHKRRTSSSFQRHRRAGEGGPFDARLERALASSLSGSGDTPLAIDGSLAAWRGGETRRRCHPVLPGGDRHLSLAQGNWRWR